MIHSASHSLIPHDVLSVTENSCDTHTKSERRWNQRGMKRLIDKRTRRSNDGKESERERDDDDDDDEKKLIV